MLKTFLRPSVALMRALPLAQKFAIVCLAALVPLFYLLYTVVSDRHGVYEFTEREVKGIAAIKAFDGAYVPVMGWRGAFAGSVAGQDGAAARRDGYVAEAEKELVGFETYLKDSGDPLALAPEFTKLRQKWAAVRAGTPKNALEAFEQADAMVAAVRGFIEYIANNSNLALDPDVDTYALMLAYTSEVPRLMDALARVRSVGRFLADGKIADDPEMFMALHNADALLDEYLERAGAVYAQAKQANPEALSALRPEILEHVEAKVVSRIDSEFAWGAAPKADGSEWGKTVNAVLHEIEELHDQGGDLLQALLHVREAKLQSQIWTALGLAFAFMAVAAYLLAGFYTAAQSSFSALGRRIAKLGQGDFGSSAALEGRDELARSGNQLADAMGSLTLLVLQVRSTSEEISSSVAEIAAANQDLSERGLRLAAVVEETSASTTSLEQAVGDNMASAQEANELVQSTAQVAGRGGAVVEQAVKAMNDITASSRKIGDIIQVIDSIAFQTNILALNAAVEAARAGEQGRGFAVVASEVRALAQRSAAAAREIKGLIQDSIDNVTSGGAHVNEAGNTMTEMVTAIGRITELMADINLHSSEQAQQIRELGAAIREVDRTVQENAAMVEQTAATAAGLNDRAASLARAASQFRTDI
ncbi:methyl-accepting chemotaxis protein-1 (serine sensor receptor) [Inhella inkyongensis]|uniref:Methyl-accepting chemotaxis protein-1 (Serine sensor receptor) n=1 Tax=Inhella inkyongensis TaxID=392593 RepID=A0A840SA59_9BURK|nr:methyl-accepting chemotaxis protein [Inhella inkyongensis]MBB5205289.1 methyl-accepting chemotaxis protein-1 (serine sensor receptor) [Inhella inkyongensis]